MPPTCALCSSTIDIGHGLRELMNSCHQRLTIVPNAKTPDITAENPTYATWENGATDALYHIMMTCEPNVKDQIHHINVPSMLWKKLKDLYKPLNLSMQFDYLSMIWSISLSDYSSITAYCSALEVA